MVIELILLAVRGFVKTKARIGASIAIHGFVKIIRNCSVSAKNVKKKLVVYIVPKFARYVVKNHQIALFVIALNP